MVIFKIAHIETGRCYVGYSTNDNPHFMGTGIYITRALKDHGRESFTREVLERFPEDAQLQLIMERLEYWIKYYRADDPQCGYNESISELIPRRRKLTKKLQVLLSPWDESQLNSIIIEKAMAAGKKPMSTSKYVRQLITNHIIEETRTENQFKAK